ncbi:n-terminal acetyltransferase c complex catalytic subunit mak3 [Coemansia sp. RSA 1200]|nr:n-terminal acetyltransferase c complex catalytic subunit mak3 [Coemansia sp. RSA 1200]
MDLERLKAAATTKPNIQFKTYTSESDLHPAIKLIERDLSEPYSIYTYRYFVHQWPRLCILAHDTSTAENECVGVIICKLEPHRRRYNEGYFDNTAEQEQDGGGVVAGVSLNRGYIGMVAVGKPYRKMGIGSALVVRALCAMKEEGAEEVALEAESVNLGALALYEGLGFVREKRLHRYYLGGTDAYRLKMYL